MKIHAKLIAFDLYGTLVRYRVMHHPYRKILQWARQNGRKPQPDDARYIMTADAAPEIVFSQMGIFPPMSLLDQFDEDIQEELNNLTLYDDVATALDLIASEDVQIALCSNLAKPYGGVIDKLLPQYKFIRCLSYEINAIKPEIKIYDEICKLSGVDKNKVLFIGDTKLADFDGPLHYGFHALHLIREGPSENEAIRSLNDIFAKVQL